jgi:hypothetical protein
MTTIVNIAEPLEDFLSTYFLNAHSSDSKHEVYWLKLPRKDGHPMEGLSYKLDDGTLNTTITNLRQNRTFSTLSMHQKTVKTHDFPVQIRSK